MGSVVRGELYSDVGLYKTVDEMKSDENTKGCIANLLR